MDVRVSSTAFYDITARLKAARGRLDVYQQQIRSSPAIARAIGRELTQAEAQYGELVSKYQGLRALVGMDVAPGLSAIAIGTLIWITAGAALTLGLILKGLGVLETYIREVLAVRAKTAAEAEVNRGTLLEQADAADQEAGQAVQRGDVEGARRKAAEAAALRRQAGTPGAVGLPGNWLEDNWGWLAIAGGAVLIGPRLIRSFTG